MIINQVRNLLNRVSPAFHQRDLTARFRPSAGVPARKEGPRVLFIPFYTDPLFLARETFLAKALEWRGCQTALLYSDRRIAPTERGYLEDKLGCRHPVLAGGKRLLRHLHQAGLPISRYYQDASGDGVREELKAATPQQLAAYTYRGIQLGDLAVASSVRILLSMGPEWDNPAYRELVEALLVTGVALVDTYFRAFADFKPERVVMSHAIYISWGIAFRVARHLDLPVLVYNGSYRRNTLRMYLNAPNAPFPEAEWPRFRDVPLAAAERRWAENYLGSRAELADESHDVFGTEDFPPELEAFIARAREEGKPLAALFTNMSWDAYAFSGLGPFDDMVDWANSTLEFARRNPDLRLIFKIHPAEAYWNIPEKYRIRNHLTAIPGNVFLLNETDKVKPFRFYRHIDFGIINISTVAVEMAYLDIPVLTSGARGHYENQGFTISPADREAYSDHLSRLMRWEHDFQPDREQLLRYVYYRFFRESVPFEPLLMNGNRIKEVTIDSYDDLRPGKLPGVDTLAEGILHARPVVWQGPTDQA